MPRGGARPGAGRPRNPENVGVDQLPAMPGITPLQFLKRVARDPKVSVAMRIRAAKAALPYLYSKKSGRR